MRIMVLTPAYPAYEGDSASKFVEELSKSIIEKGNDISVFIVTPHRRTGIINYEEKGNITIVRFKYTVDGRLEYLSKDDSFADYLKESFATKFEILSFLIRGFSYSIRTSKKSKIDIINSHWLAPEGLIGALLHRITKKPHIMTLHAGGVLLLKKYPFKEKIATFVGRNSDFILPVSGYIRDEYLKMVSEKWREEVKKKCIVVPMGTNINKYYPVESPDSRLIKERFDIPIDKISIGFLGRLSDKKGVRYLIDAMLLLKNAQPDLFEDVFLNVGGTGPLKGELQDIVSRHHIEDHVKFHDFIPDDRKNEFMNAMDIFVLPSIITKAGDTEGLPVVLMEAMATGKAVIGTNVSGMGETLIHNENGMMVKPENPKDISNALIELIRDIKKREQLGINARKYAIDTFSWEVVGDKYYSVIQSLTEKGQNA